MENTNLSKEAHEEIQAEVFIEKSAKITWPRLIPTPNRSVKRTARSVSGYVANFTGEMKRSTGGIGTSRAIVGYKLRKESIPLTRHGASYQIADEELEDYGDTGVIDPIKMNIAASVIAYNNTLQTNIVDGYDGFVGIKNLPFASGAMATAAVKWTSDNITPEMIANDILASAGLIFDRTETHELPDTMALPAKAYWALISKMTTDSSKQTAFDLINRALSSQTGTQQNVDFVPVANFGTDLIMYPRDPDVLVLHQSVPLEYDDPIRVDGGYTISFKSRQSPVEIRNALAFGKLLGVA